MDTNPRHERPAPDPHFERLHGPPLNYAQSMQSFLQGYDPQPASTVMGFPAEASGFSHPTVPNAGDFTYGKAPARNMPPPPTPGFLSGFQTPCESTCSIVNCDSGCNPSVIGSGSCSLLQCNNLDQCTSEECCREPACLDHSSFPTTRRESIDFNAEDQFASSSSQHQVANSGAVYPAYDNSTGFDDPHDDPLQCHWLLPDQECDITAPTNDALSQHVFHDHIQPETSLIRGSSDYDEQMNAQQLTHEMWSSDHPDQNAPDSYVCLWDACLESFIDAEQLEMHMAAAHSQTEGIDCRWGGCGTITANSAELQSHVNKEHLTLHVEAVVPSSSPEIGPSNSRSFRRPDHPLYWTSENDDLLMRVRAQNLTYPQIASQYFPDKSAQALQARYTRLCEQQEQVNPQTVKQSTPLLTYTPSQPASTATSPYGSHHLFVDPSLIQTSPTILSNHSSQLAFYRFPIQEDHKCMWVIDDTTEALCEAHFENPNELQAHVESSHYPLSEIRKRRPNSHWVCKWMGCALKRETRGSKDKLKKHICTHTGYYSLSCRHCGKRVRDGTKLADHERTHTGEKPHKCSMCEMAFANRDGLTTHYRIHTGEKPLECGKCPYTCSDSSNMVKHRKAHEPPLYSCPMCGKQFCRADSRDRHMRLHQSGTAGRKRVHGLRRDDAWRSDEDIPRLGAKFRCNRFNFLFLTLLIPALCGRFAKGYEHEKFLKTDHLRPPISAGAKSKVKSSVQRAIRTKVCETYPQLAPHIDEVIPKKSQLDLVKLPDRVSLYALDSTPLFWQHMDDPLIPHLRVVHQFPNCFNRIGIDRGAIRFVLSGATLMAPGLTSAGGKLPDKDLELKEGDVAVVEAEGKEEACLIGQLRMGTEEIKEKKKGVVMDSGHYLGDGLWKISID